MIGLKCECSKIHCLCEKHRFCDNLMGFIFENVCYLFVCGKKCQPEKNYVNCFLWRLSSSSRFYNFKCFLNICNCILMFVLLNLNQTFYFNLPHEISVKRCPQNELGLRHWALVTTPGPFEGFAREVYIFISSLIIIIFY